MTVSIPDGVEHIGKRAFWMCNSLKTVVIPEGIESLSEEVFASCKGMETVYLPVSLTSIGKSVFGGSYSVTDIYYAGTLEQWEAIEKNEQETGHWKPTSPSFVIHCSDGDITVVRGA